MGEPTTPSPKTPQNEHTTTDVIRHHTRYHFRLRTRCKRNRRRKAVQDQKTGSQTTQDLERRGNGIPKEYRCRPLRVHIIGIYFGTCDCLGYNHYPLDKFIEQNKNFSCMDYLQDIHLK